MTTGYVYDTYAFTGSPGYYGRVELIATMLGVGRAERMLEQLASRHGIECELVETAAMPGELVDGHWQIWGPEDDRWPPSQAAPLAAAGTPWDAVEELRHKLEVGP